MARQYWVVSPNVDGKGKKVEEWEKEILRHRAAIMGWQPQHPIGRRFKNDIQIDDIILIARGKKSADMVGFGVVKGRSRKQRFPDLLDEPVYLRALEPFIRLRKVPQEIPILDVLQHTMALRQLCPNPQEKDSAWQVCQWMERQLGDQEGDSDVIKERGLPKSNTYDYEVRTPERVTEFRKREKELLDDYERWLKKQGQHLSALPYGQLKCDAWDEERRNLIEAKGSTSREDIRMAVGQLFDYSFQGKEKCKQPNMAILFPRKPPLERVEWLKPLGIKEMVRTGRVAMVRGSKISTEST